MDISNIADYFAAMNARGGPNFPVFYDAFERDRFLRGVVTTIELSGTGMAISLAIGIAGTFAHRSSAALRRFLIEPYVLLFRNTPVLIQLCFFYFALGPYLPKVMTNGTSSPALEGFGWTMVALSLYIGAFNVEALRGGCSAVPRTLVEASEAIGFNGLQSFLYVVFPLGFRNSIPALTNNLVELVKTSALGYAVGVAEVLYVASQIWADQLNVVEMMVLIFAVYMVLIGAVVTVMSLLERALRIPGHST